MHLADTLLGIVALSPLALWLAPARPLESTPIEVVYTTYAGASFCDGCRKTVTDSIEGDADPVYTCPNGDSWTLVMGSPSSAEGLCLFYGTTCAKSGACSYSRSATLTYTDLPNNGTCGIYYRENGSTGAYYDGQAGQQFEADLTAACEYGSLSEKVCDTYRVTFFDTTLDGNTVVIDWHAKVCCNKCPD